MSIVDDIADLLDADLYAQFGALDYTGSFVPSGALLGPLPCRIEGEQRLVRDPTGQEVTTSVQVIVGGYFDLTTDHHRYFLPSQWSPNGSEGAGEGLRALYVDNVNDEAVGPLYQELSFP